MANFKMTNFKITNFQFQNVGRLHRGGSCNCEPGWKGSTCDQNMFTGTRLCTQALRSETACSIASIDGYVQQNEAKILFIRLCMFIWVCYDFVCALLELYVFLCGFTRFSVNSFVFYVSYSPKFSSALFSWNLKYSPPYALTM